MLESRRNEDSWFMLQIKHTGDLRQARCDPRTLPGGGNCNSGLHHSTILSPRDCKLLGRCRMPLGSELLSPLLTYSSVRYQSTHSYSSNRSNCSSARSRRLALPQFETTVASKRQLHSSNSMATGGKAEQWRTLLLYRKSGLNQCELVQSWTYCARFTRR